MSYPPGIWEQDGELHFDAAAILRAHGVENPTPEEIDAAAGMLAALAAELMPGVDVEVDE